MVVPLVERYAEQIPGMLSCFDRVVITGTLPAICHASAMTAYLQGQGIRIFDYTRFAEPLREEIREHAERLAAAAGLAIEFIRRKTFRKKSVSSRSSDRRLGGEVRLETHGSGGLQ